MKRFRRIVLTALALALMLSLCGSLYAFGAAQSGSGDIDVPFDPVKKVRKVWVSTLPTKLVYQQGESLDTTGMVVKAMYSDGLPAKAVSGYTVSGYSANTPGEQTITVSFGGKTATFTVTVAGTVDEPVAEPGDINGNGAADKEDADLLQKYVAGQNVQIDTGAADFNGDGTVDGKDATLLMRYLAGWDVNLGK